MLGNALTLTLILLLHRPLLYRRCVRRFEARPGQAMGENLELYPLGQHPVGAAQRKRQVGIAEPVRPHLGTWPGESFWSTILMVRGYESAILRGCSALDVPARTE